MAKVAPTKEATFDLLGQLDVKNDDHWTEDGLPRVDVVAALAPHLQIDRQTITGHAPSFTRDEVKKQQALDAMTDATPKVSAMDRPMQEVMQDPDALREIIGELNKKSADLLRTREAVNKELQEIWTRSDLASRQLQRLDRGSKTGTADIKKHLEVQKAVRKERQERIAQFVKKSGMSPAELAEALRTKSPIDTALGAKRPTTQPSRVKTE